MPGRYADSAELLAGTTAAISAPSTLAIIATTPARQPAHPTVAPMQQPLFPFVAAPKLGSSRNATGQAIGHAEL